jgi:hypothetical protein
MQKPRVALKYLTMALNLEKHNQETKAPELAATYLNLCAIYSELKMHGEAINKAVKSVVLLKNFLRKIAKKDVPNTDLENVIKTGEKDKQTLKNNYNNSDAKQKASA